MFKKTVRLFGFLLLLSFGFLMLFGNTSTDKVSAAPHAILQDNCPGAPNDGWGNTGGGNVGEGYGLMGSLMVQAVDSNGSPLNVDYTLNSDLKNNSNSYLDKRIFKYPAGSSGRDNQHNFVTGENMTDGTSTWHCNGWSVLGAGTAGHAGNGWVVDCGGGGSGAGSSEFWISHIDNPNGATGTWKAVNRSTGQVLSTDVNSDGALNRSIKSGVVNGGNVQFYLVWTPSNPVGSITAQRCIDSINVSGVNDGTGSPKYYVQLTSSGGSSPDRFPNSGYYNDNGRSINVPDWVKNRTGDADVGVQLYVLNSDGTLIKVSTANIGEPWKPCGNPTTQPCSGNNCPTCPTLGTDPVDINLPNHRSSVPGPLASDGTPGYGKPYGTTTQTDGNPAIRNTAGDERFNIQSITANDIRGNDISSWPTGTSMNYPNQHWTPQLSGAPPWSNPPSPWSAFSINYAPLIGNFPYDSVTPIAHYTEWYGQYHYKATGAKSGNYWAFQYTGETWHVLDGSNFSTALPTLHECYNRGFHVNTPSASSQLQGPPDQPTSAKFSFSGSVDFSLPHGSWSLLTPMKVCGLNYSASYYITNDAHGGRTPLPSHSGDSGSLGCISDSGGGSGSYSLNTGPYSVSGLQAGDEVCADFTVTPSGTEMDENGTITAASGSASTSTNCSAPVVNEPYFKVFNSGISAGGSFGCSNSGGVLAGFNDDTGADRGAGAQLSSLALVGITGVASAQNAAAGAPTGLTFANTGVNPVTSSYGSPSLGGSFGGTRCLTGESAPQTATADLGASATVGSGVLADGAHTYASSNFTLAGGNVALGKNPAVFITGHNVYISSNGNGGIKYSGGTAASPWTVTDTSTNVPSFVLMVTGGNIYIDPSITELDGTYIAASSAGIGGKIYTCANGFSPMPANAMFNNCATPLTVYGSFVADQVDLGRTRGSLRESSPGETAASNNAAEIFNFSPEMYTSKQSVTPPGKGSIQYKAWTNLPPVL